MKKREMRLNCRKHAEKVRRESSVVRSERERLTARWVQHDSDAGAECLRWNVGCEFGSDNTAVAVWSGHSAPDHSDLCPSLLLRRPVDVCDALKGERVSLCLWLVCRASGHAAVAAAIRDHPFLHHEQFSAPSLARRKEHSAQPKSALIQSCGFVESV